ncbi:MAG: class I SAM-dependent methyltransferase [Hymenobacter sp.]
MPGNAAPRCAKTATCLAKAPAPSTWCTENGHQFAVDWETGQKTGFFIDQRDNRALLARYSPGRRVLNTFCYTGGFSVYALAAGRRAGALRRLQQEGHCPHRAQRRAWRPTPTATPPTPTTCSAS